MATGRLEWQMANPAEGFKGFGTHSENPVSGTAAADLDGDGRDEALISMGKALFCLAAPGKGSTGELRWRVELPAQIGPPTVVQLEKNGPVSILVVGSDGYVYCLR
jgi:outer membrane protein assembly factor BamB